MVDVFDPEKRSAVMSNIRGRGNKSTELAMAKVLRQAHVTGWRRHIELRPKPADADVGTVRLTKSQRVKVRPDFVFRKQKTALFVDGCFWHRCPLHSTKPDNNADFWAKKLEANVRRDAVHTRALEAAGWRVLRFWEHELSDVETTLRRIVRALSPQWPRGVSHQGRRRAGPAKSTTDK